MDRDINYQPQFSSFLSEVEQTEYPTNATATGTITIQQSIRNELRKRGVQALKADLEWLYGDLFDVVETKEGIVIVAENEPGDFTFSWELKNTIKSIDYDPFVEANLYEENLIEKQTKKEKAELAKKTKLEEIARKRAAKMAEVERRKNLTTD